MTKFFLTAAATLALAAPAFAAPAGDKISFTRDGVRYIATVATHDGVQDIVGREIDTGREFALHVANGRVSGLYDGAQVAYAVPAVAMQTASR